MRLPTITKSNPISNPDPYAKSSHLRFFRLYLESKDPTDFNGLETYCWEQQQQGRITWFPIKKAIIIEGRNKEKKDIPGLCEWSRDRTAGSEERAAR